MPLFRPSKHKIATAYRRNGATNYHPRTDTSPIEFKHSKKPPMKKEDEIRCLLSVDKGRYSKRRMKISLAGPKFED